MKKINSDNQTEFSMIGDSRGPLDRFIAKILLYGIPIVILIAGLSYIIVQKDMNRNLINENSDTQSKIEKLNYDMKNNIDTLNQDFAVKSMNAIFNKVDLTFKMNKFWKYSLTVNGKDIKDSSTNVSKGNITIVLTETKAKTILPDAVVDVAKVTGGDALDKTQNHFFIDTKDTTIKNVNTTVSPKDKYVLKLTYTVKATAKGKIVFTLSPQMENILFGKAGKFTFTVNVK